MEEPRDPDYLVTCVSCKQQFEPPQDLENFIQFADNDAAFMVIGDNLVSVDKVEVHCKPCTTRFMDEEILSEDYLALAKLNIEVVKDIS